MLDRLRSLLKITLILALTAFPFGGPLPAVHAAACTGSLRCKACQNCNNCTHCGKQGGICGVCLGSPAHSRSAPRTKPAPARPVRARPTTPRPAPSPSKPATTPSSAIPSRPETPGRTAFDFRDRVLVRQKFNRLDLREADFTGANLRGAELREAHLERAKLAGAYLCGADFTSAYLTDADLKGAWYDLTTRWPEGFDPKAAGAKSVE